jgi:hypothetical protein
MRLQRDEIAERAKDSVAIREPVALPGMVSEAVVRRFSQRAGARDGAAAVVGPLAIDLLAGAVGHENLSWP